jgi:DNA-binding response OmpR family regulator
VKTNFRVWILEDEPDAIFVYREILELRYHLRFFSTLEAFGKALEVCQTNNETPFDLLIADLRLPDGNFLEFLGMESTSDLISAPFLVISSCDDLDILRACFNEGTLDYLTKPFTKSELVVKIERILKSTGGSKVKGEGIVFDPSSLVVRKGDDIISNLTAKEVQIFSVLHKRLGKRVTRRTINSEVWKDISVSPKTLDVHLFNLRKKVFSLGLKIQFIPPDEFILSGDEMHVQTRVDF